jgi:hypothetical protein
MRSRYSLATLGFVKAAPKPTHSFELYRVYHYDLTGKVSFGDLSVEAVHKILKDGRACARFLEHHVPLWFPDLEYVDKKGFDFISRVNGQKIECKTFTESGLNYAPSSMTGKGRTIDRKQLHQEAPLLIFILCDIVDFPRVRIVFRPGSSLVEKYPAGKVPFNDRLEIFC